MPMKLVCFWWLLLLLRKGVNGNSYHINTSTHLSHWRIAFLPMCKIDLFNTCLAGSALRRVIFGSKGCEFQKRLRSTSSTRGSRHMMRSSFSVKFALCCGGDASAKWEHDAGHQQFVPLSRQQIMWQTSLNLRRALARKLCRWWQLMSASPSSTSRSSSMAKLARRGLTS